MIRSTVVGASDQRENEAVRYAGTEGWQNSDGARRTMRTVLLSLMAIAACVSCAADLPPDVEKSVPDGGIASLHAERNAAGGSPETQPAGAVETGEVRHRGVRKSYWECRASEEKSFIEKAHCVSEESEFQDRRLNTVYKELLALVRKNQAERLVSAQRAWLGFHREEGMLEGTVFGAEQIENIQVAEREMIRISDRADDLETYRDLLLNQP